MRLAREQDGTYAVASAAMLLRAWRCVLPDAVVPSVAPPQGMPAPLHGMVAGVCPAPNKSDRYLVEFVGERAFRILAYVDRYGRVFSTSEPVSSPPAREPDLCFARYAEQPRAGEEHGCVEVRDADGTMREVARYACAGGRYTLFDSWYDFGPYSGSLAYDEALARAYFAFVHRPSLGGAPVPKRGLGFVEEHLADGSLPVCLRDIRDDVRRAENDPVVRPPALARCLARWLEEAGLDAVLATVPDDALRLVRTVRYANLYFIAVEDDDAPIDRRTVWALESALNRFALLEEEFGDRASTATEADCGRWEAYLMETAAARPLPLALPAGAPRGLAGREWDVRCRLAAALERLRLPVRVEGVFRANVEEGVVAFELTVPDGALMPRWRWVDEPGKEGWVLAAEGERAAQARRYAMRAGLALAAAAFEVADAACRVDVVARPLGADAPGEAQGDARGAGGEFPVERQGTACYQATFTRRAYEEGGRFRAALAGDPAPLFAACGAVFDLPDADAFAVVEALPSTVTRRELPELADSELPEEARIVLGADEAGDLRIVADARRRRIAESLADEVARASSATQAIRAVRREQDAAERRGDDLTVAACTRLMAALAEGSLDTEDQNAAVVCFLGEDRCLAALGRARTLAQRDPAEAVAVLADAVAEAAALDGYVDGAVTAYRSFDSYAARVLYGRALRAARQAGAEAPPASLQPAPTLASQAAADAGRRILLAPDSLYVCLLEIVTLLESSFDRVEDALRYGRRAIELAPATAGGYRQLGRAYMLVGDMDNAAAVFEAGLHVAVQPADIAVAYYQLAYALWKAGKPHEGAACYLKSVMTAPIMALQAVAELKELIAEHGLDPIERDAVDGLLRDAGIVMAPVDEVFEALDAGAAAAVDAGLFPVARNLLSLRLHHRPDDALVNVLKSLERDDGPSR